MDTDKVEDLLRIANSIEDAASIVNAEREFGGEDEATTFLKAVRERLLRIDDWNQNSTATEYRLFGEDVDDNRLKVGSFIRIRLYGSGKYDWVRVESIIDHPDERIVRVRPSYDPTEDPVDKSVISHFFGPEATNNFCVKRDGSTVAMYVIGLEERQNTKFTDGLIESGRNAAVANVGYYSGLQSKVWEEFCKSFLELDKEMAR